MKIIFKLHGFSKMNPKVINFSGKPDEICIIGLSSIELVFKDPLPKNHHRVFTLYPDYSYGFSRGHIVDSIYKQFWTFYENPQAYGLNVDIYPAHLIGFWKIQQDLSVPEGNYYDIFLLYHNTRSINEI